MNPSDIILEALIVVALILPYILLFIVRHSPNKERLALEKLGEYAKYAVQKVQQQFIGDNLQKKDLAVHIIENCFRVAKLPIPDILLIDAAVESFVYEMKQLAGPSNPPEHSILRTGPLPIPPSPLTNTLPPPSA